MGWMAVATVGRTSTWYICNCGLGGGWEGYGSCVRGVSIAARTIMTQCTCWKMMGSASEGCERALGGVQRVEASRMAGCSPRRAVALARARVGLRVLACGFQATGAAGGWQLCAALAATTSRGAVEAGGRGGGDGGGEGARGGKEGGGPADVSCRAWPGCSSSSERANG